MFFFCLVMITVTCTTWWPLNLTLEVTVPENNWPWSAERNHCLHTPDDRNDDPPLQRASNRSMPLSSLDNKNRTLCNSSLGLGKNILYRKNKTARSYSVRKYKGNARKKALKCFEPVARLEKIPLTNFLFILVLHGNVWIYNCPLDRHWFNYFFKMALQTLKECSNLIAIK